MSNPPANGSTVGYLENYGFQGMTNPDPVGTNGQGAADDVSVIATSAAQWLRQKARSAAPFCVTVSFVNPHDKEFFWAGSEANRYYQAFKHQRLKPFTPNYTQVESEANPRRWGIRRSRRTGRHTTNWPSTASRITSR